MALEQPEQVEDGDGRYHGPEDLTAHMKQCHHPPVVRTEERQEKDLHIGESCVIHCGEGMGVYEGGAVKRCSEVLVLVVAECAVSDKSNK